MKSGHENTRIERKKRKKMKLCVQNEWRVVHNCPHNLITALYCSLDLKNAGVTSLLFARFCSNFH